MRRVYLAEHNHPMTFRSFASACESAGLAYLCDSDLHTAFPASLGDSVEQALADIEDGVDLEQWLDFVGNRAFRQSLLIRDDSPLDEGISLERFATFSLAADLTAPQKPRLRDTRPVQFQRPSGEAIDVLHPLTKSALGILCADYPDAHRLPELLHLASRQIEQAGAGALTNDLDSALAELFGLFARGAIQASLAPRRIDPALPEHPRARALVRALVAAGHTEVPTRDHTNLELDPLAARLIRLLDGSRDIAELTEGLAEALAPDIQDQPALKGAKTRTKGRTPAPSPAQRVLGLLALFRRYGILKGGLDD